MALVFEARYSKKLGLPGYSSHEYAVTVRTELTDMNQVQAESSRLYALLQSSVDREIQEAGWLPESNGNGDGHQNGRPANGSGRNGNGHYRNGNGHSDQWACTGKQKELILKIVDENRLDKIAVENTAQELFGKAVRALNKMEASGLIEELFRQTGAVNGHSNGNGNGHSRYQKAGAR